MQVSTFDAKTHLSALLDKVAHDGEIIIITRRGKPVAKISPVDEKHNKAQIKKAIAAIKTIGGKNTLGKDMTIRELIGRDRDDY